MKSEKRIRDQLEKELKRFEETEQYMADFTLLTVESAISTLKWVLRDD